MGAISRYITRRYINRVGRVYIEQFPQLACYSFDLITNIIMLDGQYERDQLEFLSEKVFPLLDARGTCVDVGANIGNHSVFFAKHFHQVIGLEPHPRNFALLKINAELAENIVPLNIGASDASATFEIVEDRMNLAASSIHRSEGRTGDVVELRVARIDDFPEIQAAERITFMKIDIEGHEDAAIAGAAETILRHQPTIMLEVLRDEISQGTAASIEALRGLGYTHFYEPVEAGWLGMMPSRLKKLIRAGWEVVSGRRLSKAGRVVQVKELEPRNYLMVLCSIGETAYVC